MAAHRLPWVASFPTSSPDPAGVDPLTFDDYLYRAWNRDVDAAICAGAIPSALHHWESHGKAEQRPPFAIREGNYHSPRLRAGDAITQPLTTRLDWLGGIAIYLITEGQLCHVVVDGTIRDAQSDDVLATFVFDDWIEDKEEEVMKFTAIEDSSHRSLILELKIRTLDAAKPVHLWCRSTASHEAMKWNAHDCQRSGLAMELRHTPVTLEGPDGITLNPATACKASCIHCLSRTYRERPGFLKPEWISALRDHYRQGPGDSWCIDYATDFFRTAKHRPELMDLLDEGGRLVVNTDGQDVTEPVLRRLYAAKTERIGFSCDAATEETYAVVRKGLGRLETVIEAAQNAVRLRRELGLGQRPCLALSMVVMRRNVHEAALMVEQAARAGVDSVWFNHLWVCSDDMVEESLEFAPDIWRENLAQAEARGRALGIKVSNYPPMLPEHRQHGIRWCPEPWGSIVVLGNGEVLACASPASRIGNLNESSIEEIWNGPHFQALRRQVHAENPPLMCVHCPVYRKPGNSDGQFMHHLVHDYDVRKDLADPNYAEAFKKRFSFEAYRARIADRHPVPV